MGTPDDVIRIAAGEVGYSRWDDPETGTKYGRWYASLTGEDYYAENGVAYCAMFVSWVFHQARVACAGLPGAYCPAMLEEARRAGAAVPKSDARPGDVVYFDWQLDEETDHVGIVVANYGTFLETIEGNTSTGASGSQSNGGVVARRQRNLHNVCAIVRPDYDGGGTEAGTLDVDGIIGPKSVTEWQRQLKTPADGIVSGQLSECRRAYPALTAVSFDGGGSILMELVQGIVGVPRPTGVIAGGSVCHLQGWLVMQGYDLEDARAGVLDEPTARALQRSLNDRRWESA